MEDEQPTASGDSVRPALLFQELWRQLGDAHQGAMQELQAKVSRLKKERCLDAQKLEVFHSRNQQLKEQNKSLQDTVSLLEHRLSSGQCEDCAVLKDTLRQQQEDSSCLVEQLQKQRSSLEDQTRRLQAEVDTLRASLLEKQTSSPGQEEGFIPDSPVLPSSLPAANKLRKRRHVDKVRHVRYAETPLRQAIGSLFDEPKQDPVGAQVLVPDTCELKTSQASDHVDLNPEAEVPETCGLELCEKPPLKTERTEGPQRRSGAPWEFDVGLKMKNRPSLSHSPDQPTERSPSLLLRVKRLSEDDCVDRAKRRKEDRGDEDARAKTLKTRPIKPALSPLKAHSKPKGSLAPQRDIPRSSPDFKRPPARGESKKDGAGKKGKLPRHLNASQNPQGQTDATKKPKVEAAWSVDPALALSMCEREESCPGEMVDTDCTWISHSVLQQQNQNSSVSGLAEKANDSLDLMFDTTAYGHYESQPELTQPQKDQDRSDEDDEDGGSEGDPDETSLSQIKGKKLSSRPAFAHAAVIRKKDERRKLKGATCKECEVYYAHLPEHERQEKLSSCSRHRFLYIPPCTPENFWEVGFPSTQTCIDRGYIREEKSPEARPRRRQPYNALFSPRRPPQSSSTSA